MTEPLFNNGNEHDNRVIMINITNDHIEFFYYDYYLRETEYLKDKEENGEIDYMDEGEKEVNGFYWISTDEWVSDRTGRKDREDNWHKHMKTKNWFTEEMYEYIDKNVK
jgi:hypothetical protein